MADQLLVFLDMVFVGFSLLWAHVYCYVIHVDSDISFTDKIMEYSVYHCLKGGWWVGEAEEHHGWFIESFIGDECCFPLVLLFNENFVIPPFNIKPSKEGAPLKSVNQLGNEGQWVVVFDCPGIPRLVILYLA